MWGFVALVRTVCHERRRERCGKAARETLTRDEIYRPVTEHRAAYDRIYAEYVLLHDYFGRGGNDVMKRLKVLRAENQPAS